MKINVDAAISKNTHVASVAAIVWDIFGDFLGESAVVMESLTNQETIEALAFRKGLALPSDLLLHKFKMMSDCTNIVRSI